MFLWDLAVQKNGIFTYFTKDLPRTVLGKLGKLKKQCLTGFIKIKDSP